MDKSYIVDITQQILNKEHKYSIQRKIYDYNNRINFACPYCGDSSTDKHKKRGNIYFDKLMFVCFNCGKKVTFDKMCKDFTIQLDPGKKLEMIEFLSQSITFTDYENDFMDTEFDKLINMEDLDRVFNDGSTCITDFRRIEEDGIIFNYLKSRAISGKLTENIYQGKFWSNADRYEPVIILLNRRGSKVLGVQIRNLKDGRKRLFKIYNFETLYKWVTGKEEIDDIDINQLVIYNKLSYYFNILNIDFEKPITIFEGYLDSIFMPNSIGVVGTNTDVHFLEQNNLPIRYCYDNDDAGYKKSNQKIENNYPVFLWMKLFDSIVKNKKTDDPYKLMYRISKVKDLNKLAELVFNPYKKLNLEEYFSKDIYDSIWLKIPQKTKKTYTKKV